MSARGHLFCDKREPGSVADAPLEDIAASIPSGIDPPCGFGHVTVFKIQSHASAAIWQFLQFVPFRLLCFSAIPLSFTQAPILAQTSSATDTALSCTAELKAGVAVESIAKNTEGERAGLAEGDIILSWSRGDAKGQVESPFRLK
jgi:hypothetical protein